MAVLKVEGVEELLGPLARQLGDALEHPLARSAVAGHCVRLDLRRHAHQAVDPAWRALEPGGRQLSSSHTAAFSVETTKPTERPAGATAELRVPAGDDDG